MPAFCGFLLLDQPLARLSPSAVFSQFPRFSITNCHYYSHHIPRCPGKMRNWWTTVSSFPPERDASIVSTVGSHMIFAKRKEVTDEDSTRSSSSSNGGPLIASSLQLGTDRRAETP